MKKNSKKLRVLDLFSGCGGLSYGFIEAGFDIVLGVDNNDVALETFKFNHKNSKALNLDLFDFKNIDIIKKELGGDIDVIIAGPPCQGFSLTGTRNFDDKRNQLYLSVIESIKKLKPKAFLIENVIGLVRLYGGSVKDEVVNRLDKLGYNVEMRVLCAADYGVPQMRKRVFFVGIRKKIGKFEFPEPIKNTSNYITTGDAISDLPSLEDEGVNEEMDYSVLPKTEYQKKMRKGSGKIYNHISTNHTDMVKNVISKVPEGGNHKDLPKGVGDSRKFNEAWTRYHSKKPSRTIDTGHRNHFHYKHNRVPTVRENARLQSFPDKFIFLGTKTKQNIQVGNAVPPLLGYHIGKRIKKILEENENKKKK